MSAEEAPRKSKLAFAVGELTYAEGFDVLLRTCALMAQRYPDWRLDNSAGLLLARRGFTHLYRQPSLCMPAALLEF